MARNYSIPLGRRASVASVLADFYGGLAEKRREKNKILALEGARNRAAMKEWEKRKKKPLTIFHAFPKDKAKEKAETSKIWAEARKLNTEAASNQAEVKRTEELDKMANQLREASNKIMLLTERAKNERVLYNLEKERLKSEYDNKKKKSDPNKLLMDLQKMATWSMKMLKTYQDLHDEENVKFFEDQLKKYQQRIRAVEPFTVDMQVNDLMPGSRPLVPDYILSGSNAGGASTTSQDTSAILQGASATSKGGSVMKKPEGYYFDRLGGYNMAKMLKDAFSVGGKSLVGDVSRKTPKKEDIMYLIWEAIQEQKRGEYGEKSKILDELLAEPNVMGEVRYPHLQYSKAKDLNLKKKKKKEK